MLVEVPTAKRCWSPSLKLVLNVPILPPPPEDVVIVLALFPVVVVVVDPVFERAEKPVEAGLKVVLVPVVVVVPPKAACCRPVLTCAETGVIKPHASPRAAAALMKAVLFMVLWIELWVSNAGNHREFPQ